MNNLRKHLTRILGRDKVLIDVNEVARRLGKSIKTIYGYIYTHRLPASRPNGHWRIAEDEVERLRK